MSGFDPYDEMESGIKSRNEKLSRDVTATDRIKGILQEWEGESIVNQELWKPGMGTRGYRRTDEQANKRIQQSEELRGLFNKVRSSRGKKP